MPPLPDLTVYMSKKQLEVGRVHVRKDFLREGSQVLSVADVPTQGGFESVMPSSLFRMLVSKKRGAGTT